MSRIKSASSASDRPQGLEPKLPAGVRHVSEVVPLVLARYGLPLEDRPDKKRVIVANETTDLFAVSIAALESVLAS
jgi:hypothetical protein